MVPPLPCVRLDLRVARMTAKMAVPFPAGAVENLVFPVGTFELNTSTLQSRLVLFRGVPGLR